MSLEETLTTTKASFCSQNDKPVTVGSRMEWGRGVISLRHLLLLTPTEMKEFHSFLRMNISRETQV